MLKKELRELGIRWQARQEMRWLTNLLANEQAVKPLLDYLMATKVGSRGRDAEKEAEWE